VSVRGVVLAFCVVALGAGEAAAWSDLGHQAIGHAAQRLLDQRTKAAVARAAGLATLRHGDLARMATWPDDIRRVRSGLPHPLDEAAVREAEAFIAQFPDHPTWHYVNLPLGMAYPDGPSPYTRTNDVVGTLLRCIAVLEGREQIPGFTKPIALRFLIHLVGDIHQPLHASAGFFDVGAPASPKLVADPADAPRAVNDLGGNRLVFATQTNLHATWDHGAVVALGAVNDVTLATLLREWVRDIRVVPADGDHRQWPRAWASESSRIAAEVAYPLLRFGDAHVKTGTPDQIERIDIAAPAYDEYVGHAAVRAAVRTQLVRAATRLAALLGRIRWA
jgi:hypothetical protein